MLTCRRVDVHERERQIKTNMEMDSHEERLHNMIQDSKREAAKEEAFRRAKELREKQKEAVSESLRRSRLTHPDSSYRYVSKMGWYR